MTNEFLKVSTFIWQLLHGTIGGCCRKLRVSLCSRKVNHTPQFMVSYAMLVGLTDFAE